VLTKTEEKQAYFNSYWQTRDLPSADARTRQRAVMIASLAGNPGSKKLLDVGCGRGGVMAYLSEQEYKISGCDLASDTISSLQAKGFEVFLFDIEQDELPGRYDGVLCLEVLQQIHDPLAALRKFSDALNENGFLIISVPNEFHLWSRLRLLFGRSHLGHFDESHIRLFTPWRAQDLFKRAGLQMEHAIPVSIIPPGMKALGWIGKTLAKIWPSLFSLSQIYRLKLR
jgi:SAM-dependent methyltransferase